MIKLEDILKDEEKETNLPEEIKDKLLEKILLLIFSML